MRAASVIILSVILIHIHCSSSERPAHELSDEDWSYYMNPSRGIYYNKAGYVTHGFQPDNAKMGVGYTGDDIIMICAQEVGITYGDYYALNNLELPTETSQKCFVACCVKHSPKSSYFNEDLEPGCKLRAGLNACFFPGVKTAIKMCLKNTLKEYLHPGNQNLYTGIDIDCLHDDLLAIVIDSLKKYKKVEKVCENKFWLNHEDGNCKNTENSEVKCIDNCETAFNLMSEIITHEKWDNVKTLMFQLRVRQLEEEKRTNIYHEVKKIAS